MRGWAGLYRLSVALGARDLLRHGPTREGVIRIAIPLDPSRYLELPWAERTLEARPGERVLDLASPKLLAVALHRAGVDVTSVDAFPLEVERWRRLAPDVRFELASLGLGRVTLGLAALAAAAFGLTSLVVSGLPAAIVGLAVYVAVLAAVRPRGLRDAWAYVRVLH